MWLSATSAIGAKASDQTKAHTNATRAAWLTGIIALVFIIVIVLCVVLIVKRGMRISKVMLLVFLILGVIMFVSMWFAATAAIGAKANDMVKAHKNSTRAAILDGVLFVVFLIIIGLLCYWAFSPQTMAARKGLQAQTVVREFISGR